MSNSHVIRRFNVFTDICLGLRVAINTENSKVIETIVEMVSVDMLQLKRGRGTPVLRYPTSAARFWEDTKVN